MLPEISSFHCYYQGTWGGAWSCRRWGWGARQGGTNLMNIRNYRFSMLVTKIQQNYNICWKVYDDIQTELAEKTQALKKMKQRVKVRKNYLWYSNHFHDTKKWNDMKLSVPGSECRDQRHPVRIWKRPTGLPGQHQVFRMKYVKTHHMLQNVIKKCSQVLFRIRN